MIANPQDVALPNKEHLVVLNPIVHRIIIIVFYTVFYAPIVMGVARYDFYGMPAH